MEIRKGQEHDIPEIISLLKISLGESMIPKSESLWSWKHLDNPFGKSPVLVAVENSKIIGVRAFLRWEFLVDGEVKKACRAVDTAVHPDFQGKGVFSNLTLRLIEELKQEGLDLIYNSPNADSMPGYLKMGWQKWGKLPLKLDFHLSVGKNNHSLEPENWETISELVAKIEGSEQAENQTNLKLGYLKWRYCDCPLFPYYFLTDQKSYLLFYRIKESKMGREIRITDLFTLEEFQDSDRKQLHAQLKEIQKLSGARFTSFSGLRYLEQDAISLGILPILKAGPEVTLRKVNPDFDPFAQNWKWSLGDLEVF
ncbi:GNAT family N-acetyltransferase [Algoriphagus aestuarii]|nr:GNAT family N-acetyltransferase [Algoriphagus aestuarii]